MARQKKTGKGKTRQDKNQDNHDTTIQDKPVTRQGVLPWILLRDGKAPLRLRLRLRLRLGLRLRLRLRLRLKTKT